MLIRKFKQEKFLKDNIIKNKFTAIFAVVLAASLFWMCSEDNHTDSFVLSGSAVKGIVSNADVDVYALDDNGVREELLATATTNSDGDFSVALEYMGAVEVVISGGSYVDEAIGETVELGESELRNILIADGNETFGITALTTIAAAHVNAHASEGLAIAIENANVEVAGAFGLSNVDISSKIPADLSMEASTNAEQPELDYGAVQAGLSELMLSNELDAQNLTGLIEAMAQDFSDGVFDGKSGDTALQFTLSITPAEAVQGLETAIESFLNGPGNASEYTTVDLPI